MDILLAKYPPQEALDPEDVGPEHKDELSMYYGGAFTQKGLLEYAAYGKLEMPLMECLSEKLGKGSINDAYLTKSEVKDDELLAYLEGVAAIATKQDLETETGIPLKVVRPLRRKYCVAVAMYSHIDVYARRARIDARFRVDNAMEVIHQTIWDVASLSYVPLLDQFRCVAIVAT